MNRIAENIQVVSVVTTEVDFERANNLARELVKRNLAACISFREVNSIYFWDSAIEESKEIQLFIKTTSECLIELQKTIEELHSYDLPEFIHWTVSGSNNYANWVLDCCKV